MAFPIQFLPNRLVLTCLWLLFSLAAPGVLAAGEPNEYELKAVMLFNLARFVQWPANAFANSNSPIVIGILGRNPFGHLLERAVEGESVNGRHIVVRYFDHPQSIQTCHILFIGSNEKSRLLFILSKLKGRPILTVSEIEGFTKLSDGMVRFYTNNQKKIRLRLNLQAARGEGLEISSKLIQVAELDTTTLFWPGFPQPAGVGLAVEDAPAAFPSFSQ